MNCQELIEWLRGFEIDHSPDGWPGVRMRQISAMCDAIESLLAENERLKHNLTTTEQTMREYQELAAKRLEEIERLKEIKMAGEIMRDLLKQRDELLAALEKCRKELSAWMRDHGDDIATQEAVADARAAIASVKGQI